jgi:KDO2-lipid IV(A) lauroyltransferase
VALLPWASLRRAGGILGVVAGSLLRIRRRHVDLAMARADVANAAGSMYASLGVGLVEFLWMAGRRQEWLGDQVRLTERARLAIEPRAASVIATAHTGNWDLVACAASRSFLPLAIITKRLSAGWLDRFWQSERRAQGIELIDGTSILSRARASLACGRSVAVLIDQAPERCGNFIEVPFLGARARCDRTPALLAARARVPLLLALGRRLADGSHLVDVPLVLEPPRRPSRAWVDDATEAMQRSLEEFVRAHPGQWLWLHRRWKPCAAEARSPPSGTSQGRRQSRRRGPTSPPPPLLVSVDDGG